MKQASRTDNWKQVERLSKAALPADIVEFIQYCRTRPHPESHLIAVLHKVQNHFGHLAQPQLQAVAQLLQIPAAKVSGVATFYHYFRLLPKGRFVVTVCLGTACYVKGAAVLVESLQEQLGVQLGQTTPDGLFTLAGTRCVGTCGLAPVLLVNNDVHAKVLPEQLPALIGRYARQAEA